MRDKCKQQPAGYANSDELDNMLDDRTAVIGPVRNSFHTKPLYLHPQPAEHHPECGCCGQTDRCDDDCDAVVIGGHRAAEQKPGITRLVVAWRWRKPVVNDQGETVGATAWELGDAPGFLPWWTNEPLIRLSDYEALQAECEKMRKDAERYQWLRDGNNEENSEATIIAANFWGDKWDDMIDDAMEPPTASKGVMHETTTK